jgi:hypothetical protein
MLSYYYDEELPAGFQDADFEQREMEELGNQIAALERKGICTHGHTVGLGADGVAHYPEAEGLVGQQRKCSDCGEVFADDDDWNDARNEVLA